MFSINQSKLFTKKILQKFKPKAIFNLAAETHVDRSIDSSDSFIKTNVLGIHSLLEILIRNKKKTLLWVNPTALFCMPLPESIEYKLNLFEFGQKVKYQIKAWVSCYLRDIKVNFRIFPPPDI